MKYLYASLALFLSLALTSVQAATYQPLVEATELNEVLAADQQLQIIDIRSAEDYAAGHIPGAISAPYGQWRGPAHNPGALSCQQQSMLLSSARHFRLSLSRVKAECFR